MKRVLLISFLLILVNLNVIGQNYFNKIYRYSWPDSANRIENYIPTLELPGGGFIAAGYTCNYVTKSCSLMVSTIDTLGNEINTHFYGDSGYYYTARSMQYTTDNNIILYVEKGRYTNPNDSLFLNLYKLDLSGNLIWSKQYSSGLVKSQGSKAIETLDRGFAIIGWTSMSNNPPVKMFIFKTDSIGNKEWDAQYGDSINYIYNGFSLIQESDSGYVLLGWTGTNGSYYGMITAIRTDNSGNKLWQKDYGLPTMYARGESITKLKDGNYLISGQDGIPFGNTNGLLIKTDTLGNVLWQKNYGFTKAAIIRGLVENNDGTVCFHLSQAFSNPTREVANLYKVNSIGDSLWSRQYVYDTSVVNNYCYGYNMISTNDGGYIISGQELQAFPATQDAWLLKIDSVGCDYGGCIPVGQVENTQQFKNITISPNPTSGNFTLQFNTQPTTGIVQLYNINSKLVLQQNISPYSQYKHLNITNLPQGIYLCKLKWGNIEASVKVLKE